MKTKNNQLLKELINSYPKGIVIGKRNLEKNSKIDDNHSIQINREENDDFSSLVDRKDANIRLSKKRKSQES